MLVEVASGRRAVLVSILKGDVGGVIVKNDHVVRMMGRSDAGRTIGSRTSARTSTRASRSAARKSRSRTQTARDHIVQGASQRGIPRKLSLMIDGRSMTNTVLAVNEVSNYRCKNYTANLPSDGALITTLESAEERTHVVVGFLRSQVRFHVISVVGGVFTRGTHCAFVDGHD